MGLRHDKISHLIYDIVIIFISIIFAVAIVKTGLLFLFAGLTNNLWFIESFLVGIFFTSIFTTAPAIVALGEIARNNSLIPVALFGAFGALLGDFIIFKIMKDSLLQDFEYLIKKKSRKERIMSLFHLKFFRKFTFFIGALVIASPLPDELGITLLSLSKTKAFLFAIMLFLFKFFGIIVIGLVARTIV